MLSSDELTDFLECVSARLLSDPYVRAEVAACEDPTEVREQVLTERRVEQAIDEVVADQRSAALRLLNNHDALHAFVRRIHDDLTGGGR